MSRAERLLQWEILVDLLRYDYKTGVFSGRSDGLTVGYVGRRGYVVIRIEAMNFLAHRLAWFYLYRFWPNGEVHHKNEVKTDNRMSNLEMLSKAEHKRRHLEHLRYGSKLGEPRIFKFAPKRSDAIGIVVRILTPMGYCLALWPGSLPGEGYQVVAPDRTPVTDCMSLGGVEGWIEVEQQRRCASDISFSSNMAGIDWRVGNRGTNRAGKGIVHSRVSAAEAKAVARATHGNEKVIGHETS